MLVNISNLHTLAQYLHHCQCHAQSHTQGALEEVSSNTHPKYPSICQASWEGFTTHAPWMILLALAIIYFSYKGYKLLTKGHCITR